MLHRIAFEPPPEVRRALAFVQEHDATAFVAGGALRDLILGKSGPKDIDVFAGPRFAEWARLGDPVGWDMRLERDEAELNRYRKHVGKNMVGLWGANPRGQSSPPVQIIARSPVLGVEATLSDFDFGFCQVAWDGCATYGTPAFARDATENTATYTLKADDPRKGYSEQRARGLLKKFPGRRFMFPLNPA